MAVFITATRFFFPPFSSLRHHEKVNARQKVCSWRRSGWWTGQRKCRDFDPGEVNRFCHAHTLANSETLKMRPIFKTWLPSLKTPHNSLPAFKRMEISRHNAKKQPVFMSLFDLMFVYFFVLNHNQVVLGSNCNLGEHDKDKETLVLHVSSAFHNCIEFTVARAAAVHQCRTAYVCQYVKQVGGRDVHTKPQPVQFTPSN